MPHHDLVGIGGSAGALPALQEILKNFASEAPATFFVVLHRADSPSYFVETIQRQTSLRVCEPEDGDPVLPNHIYLAPIDCHLLVASNHVHLRRGPRENGFRPSVDPLFRSLAVFGSSRSIGIVLSGYLDDGAAGLLAVKRCGGMTIVQDPSDALAPSMPRAAISAVGEPELIASASEIGQVLPARIATTAGTKVDAPNSIRLELLLAGLEEAKVETEESLGELSPYNCPDCNGVLWQIEDGPLLRFRCHTGHAYSATTLLDRQGSALEQSLYETLRGHRERARLLRQLAKRDGAQHDRWKTRAGDHDRDAALIERLILDAGGHL